jgi:ribosomal protein L22
MTEQPEDKITETEGLVPDPESETATPPAGDELQAAVDDAAGEVAEPQAAAEESEAADEAPDADEKPKPRRRRAAAKSSDEPPAEKAEKSAAPTPSRRRAHRDPDAPAPVVRAQAKHVRSSARKARLVCDHIRGKSVEEARAILALTPRAIAEDWSKLLESAIANAEHNHELVGEDLYVKAVYADEGPTIKRFRPRAQGRATRIRKRTSHLTIQLTPKD